MKSLKLCAVSPVPPTVRDGQKANHSICIVRLTAAMLLCLLGSAWAVSPSDDELDAARRWSSERLGGDPTALPFSFAFGGRPSRDVLKDWPLERSSRKLDDQRTQYILTYTDPQSQVALRCEAIEYHDFPTVEWTLYFRNAGRSDSPIIENIQALDSVWQRGVDCEFLLHHAVGSPANGSDYGPLEMPLTPGATKRISAAGGRPTNSDWSYFNLQWGGQGAIIVVGWPGQWAAEFARDQAAGIRIRAGQELTHFKLLPGEEIRSPLIVLQFWHGDRVRSQNIWRRWMMAHSMPRPGGKLPPPQFVASSSRAYEEMIGANEANQIMHIDRYLEEGLKLDYWWMDAGWYIQQHGWPQVGTWEVDPNRFPRGFRPISDHAHSKGVKILVWFEPERVAPGTWLYENRPQWLLSATSGQTDSLAGMRAWSAEELGGSDPCVGYNPTSQVRSVANIRWEPGRLSFHPGPKGEYSVVRFTAAEAGEYAVQATFLAIDRDTTTNVHVLRGGNSVFDGWVNLHGKGNKTTYDGKLALDKGEALDFIVGWGNGSHTCDSTGLEIRLTSPSGKTFDAAHEFSAEQNPGGPWSYGYLKPGDKPDSSTLRLYDRPRQISREGVRLLNLGNPAARQWLTDHVDKLLTEQRIDLYRQDFNMDPLAFWRAADAPDRQGITEIQYVTGYLAYWDELRRRHPDMLIDSCASGGRRNDLETMRRAVPLWRSDYAYEATGHQCMTYGLSFWLPYHGTGTVASASAPYYGGGATEVEPYAWWSNAAPSLGSGIDIRVKDLDYAMLRRLYNQFRQISPYYYGDYYPLTPWTRDNKVWMAWQLDRPEAGDGIIQAFRRPEAEADSIRLKLGGLESAGQYKLTSIDGGDPVVMGGRELMADGFPVTIHERPGVAIFVYQRVQP
ncbi:MAG: alpha-galactosidase [Thermoguttaceae bacterium]|nr:alpha-galactosidase [Thermoguttaceae bacterium]